MPFITQNVSFFFHLLNSPEKIGDICPDWDSAGKVLDSPAKFGTAGNTSLGKCIKMKKKCNKIEISLLGALSSFNC